LTEVVQFGSVFLAHLSPIPQNSPIGKGLLPRGILGGWLVQSIDGSRDFLHEPTVNKLTHLESRSAMWTLLSLFSEPLSDTVPAAQFGAVGAQDRILNFAEANEALEDLVDVLVSSVQICLPLFPHSMATRRLRHLTAESIGKILLDDPSSVETWNGAHEVIEHRGSLALVGCQCVSGLGDIEGVVHGHEGVVVISHHGLLGSH
jgi:hypothetical protein